MLKIICRITTISLFIFNLFGCGGGSSGDNVNNSTPKFSQLIVFGDSLTDSGTYQVGTIKAVGGGKYTVNSSGAKVWIENVAAFLGLPNACPAQTGLPNVLASVEVQGFVGAELVDHLNCTNYAQAAARVDVPYSIDSYAMQQTLINLGVDNSVIEVAAPLGKMATPISKQMANHINRNPNGFSGQELVIVFAGAVDLFMNLAAIEAAFDSKVTGSQVALSALFAGWDKNIQYQLAIEVDPSKRGDIAVNAGFAFMSNLAKILLDNVRNQLINKGAKNISIINMPDISNSAGYRVYPHSNSLQKLLNAFNGELAKSDLKLMPNILFVDAFTQSKDQASNPNKYGLINTTDRACIIGVPPNNQFLNRSSLGCSAETIILDDKGQSMDVSHYLYADGVHPTPYGHQLFSNFFILELLTKTSWGR